METIQSQSPYNLDTNLKLETIVSSHNVAEHLDSDMQDAIGRMVCENFDRDKNSRVVWEQNNESALKLALQVKEMKNFPWENCSNVKFPLLTIASLQFLARVSLLTKGRVLARTVPIGNDPQGRKSAQAARISTHLTMQINDEDPTWHDHDEQAKLSAAIIGASFKKTYYDPVLGINRSEHIPAADLVLDYYTKDIESANRITHVISMPRNVVQERFRRGLFLEMKDAGSLDIPTNILSQTMDTAEGMTRPNDGDDEVFQILEQHTWLDLDGDGYAEPYIISVRYDTCQLLRIVARFYDTGDVHRKHDIEIKQLENRIKALEMAMEEESRPNPTDAPSPAADLANTPFAARHNRMMEISSLEKQISKLESSKDNHIVRIEAHNHFVRYLFIPSVDGGVYGMGFGLLLTPLNESVNSLINQLIDSGTMSNTAGGFLGRGVKLKGGTHSFAPFEWKPVDSTGDDLRKSVFPLPVREPSAVLFQLLQMLVTYSEKVSGSTDIMTGISPGQNTPAETSRNTIAQGMMLFSGIYNRMYRAFRTELEHFSRLNELFLPLSPRYMELIQGENAILSRDDYVTNRFRIYPAASPEAVTQEQLKDKMKELLGLSAQVPGFNKYEVMKRYLESAGYDDIDKIYPHPQGPNAVPAPQDPKMEMKKMELQMEAKKHQDEMQLEIASLQSEINLTAAKISELEAKAQLHLSQADGIATGHQISIINAQIGAAKNRQEGLLKALDILQKSNSSTTKEKGSLNDSNPKRTPGLGAQSGNSLLQGIAPAIQGGNNGIMGG